MGRLALLLEQSSDVCHAHVVRNAHERRGGTGAFVFRWLVRSLAARRPRVRLRMFPLLVQFHKDKPAEVSTTKAAPAVVPSKFVLRLPSPIPHHSAWGLTLLVQIYKGRGTKRIGHENHHLHEGIFIGQNGGDKGV